VVPSRDLASLPVAAVHDGKQAFWIEADGARPAKRIDHPEYAGNEA